MVFYLVDQSNTRQIRRRTPDFRKLVLTGQRRPADETFQVIEKG